MRIKQSAAVITMLVSSGEAIRVHEAPQNATAFATPANSGLITLEQQIEKHHHNKESELKKKIKMESDSVKLLQKDFNNARIELETDQAMLMRHHKLSSDSDDKNFAQKKNLNEKKIRERIQKQVE